MNEHTHAHLQLLVSYWPCAKLYSEADCPLVKTMVHSTSSTRRDNGEGQLHEAGNSLLRVVEGYGNSARPDLFMMQCIFADTFSAIELVLVAPL